MGILNFLFYSLYSFYKKTDLKLGSYTDESRAFMIVGMLTVLFSFNIMSVFYLYLPDESIIYIGIFFLALNYFLFYYKAKYQSIYNKYQSKSIISDKYVFIKSILVLLYIVFSFLAIAVIKL